ncbi:MAG: MMPL family transporter [Candidatus Latescibacteria bacterium]|nr:MMPL family transporter [Candidatus Latescibacterota bacterium]
MTLLDRYINFILRYQWLVVLLATLSMLAAAVGMPGITVSSSYRVLFGEDNPHLLVFDKLQDTYSASRSALIAISAREGTVFTREALAAIEELTEAAWQTPHSIRVNSLTNYFHSEAIEDYLTIAPLVEDAASFSDAELDRIRTIALNQPELVGQLIAEDGRTVGVVISFALSEPEEPAWAEISNYLEDLLNEARAAHPDLAYFLTGNVIMNQAFTDAVQDDGEKLVPIVFLVILVIAALLMRSIYTTLSIAVILLFIVLSTMGVAGWLGIMLTPVSASVPIIIMTVGVAQAIHIVTLALSGMRRGVEKNAALADSLRDNLYPVFLTSATTSVGFLSLNTSSSPPFHVLGNLVALGVLFTFIYSVTFLPAMFSILPIRVKPLQEGEISFFDCLGARVVAHHKLLLWSSILVVVVLATGVLRNELSDNWLHHFDDRYTFRTDTDFIIENLTGLDRLEYSLSSGREGGITNPEYLHTVDSFAEWYRAQPEVHHVQAFPDIMKRLNENMHGDDPAFYRIPDDPELAAQFLLLYEFSLPFGTDLNDRMDVAKSATRMTVVLKNTSTRDHLDIDARARNWLQANASKIAGPASGFTMISAHLSNQNVNSMLVGTILATGLISLILILVFRNVYIGLICLVPNFVPAILAFGLWGHIVGHVGLGASVVTAIAIGIIVDDTIHFLSKYLKARRQRLSSSDAVRATFRVVGPALWATTAILTAGFLVFASSGYEPNWVLGLLVAITIFSAFVADLVLLPTLLMAIDRKSP